MKAISARCKENGALLIMDEIQTGFGRTGRTWGFQHFKIVPDIVLLGKALGGGLPLGAFVANRKLMSTLTVRPVLGHITTFGGHPVSCAAGLAACKVLLKTGLIDSVREKEKLFHQHLHHPKIKAIRSFGLLIALEFESESVCLQVAQKCIENGVLTDWFLFAPHCLRIAPPLSISEKEIRKICKIIHESIALL